MATRKITQNDDGLPTVIQAEGDDLFGSGVVGSRPASGDYENDLWLLDDGAGNFYLQRWDGSAWDHMTVAPPQGGSVTTAIAKFADTTGAVLANSGVTISAANEVRHAGTVEFDKGADIASAATLSLGTDGNYFDVTGTTTITALSTKPVGTPIILHFDGAVSLTHSSGLYLRRAKDHTTRAGEHIVFVSEGSGNWREVVRESPPVDTFRFSVMGAVSAGSDPIDNAWIAPRPGTIIRVTLYRHTAGSSGDTIVDVHKGATTIYTTQANRPTVSSSDGDDAIDATTSADFDVTTFAQDDRFTGFIDAAETGPPIDVAITIDVEYD